MSLYGALFSGVSGLNAQSSKIGIISDNIANTNTIGYKQTQARFETLVTAQAAAGAYSPGGVLGGSRQLVDRQGLLVTTDSPTDIAVSGAGLLVVNTGADGTGDTVYTRSGSFRPDSVGNFQNGAGFYLMAWPLDSEGRLPGEAGNLNTTPNTNLESLQVVNVKQVSGVAVSTTRVEINANLKATQSVYSGAGATGAMDALSTINADVTANDIIIPGSVNGIDRGDKFTITIDSTPSTFRYGGYTFSREVSSGGTGDNNVAKLDASDTLGGTDLDASTSRATGTISADGSTTTITVTATAHGFSTGDQVTLSGLTSNIAGVPFGEINGAHTITVTGANTYTFTVSTASTGGSAATNTEIATEAYHPYAVAITNGDTTALIRHADHGLHTGDVVTFSGLSAVGNITATELNDSYIITVLDEDSYTIELTTTPTSSTAGGGTSGSASKRIFSGNMLDATTVSQRFLGTTGTSSFLTDALSFTITTATVGTVTFTYTNSTPNAALGQFNTMNNLATAINTVSGLNARVANGRLYISPDDANEAISFANGADEATADSNGNISYGIDWVREFDIANQSAGLERFNTLQGLSDLVNAVDGMSATISNPTSDASIRIFTDDPLGTISFDDPEAETAASITGITIATSAGSRVITVTQSDHGYRNGDKINFEPQASPGAFGGLTSANLTDDYIITVIDSNTYTFTAATAATTTDSDASQTVDIQANKNDGSLLAELGFVTSLNSGAYSAGSTGELGPEYEPANADKNMAGGEITPQFSRPLRIYDSLGSSHDVRLGFIKTANNTWAVELYAVPATDVAAASGQIAYGTLTFNGDGSLASVESSLSDAISINWQNGAAASSISIDWGTAGALFGTEGAAVIGKTDGMSQFDADYNVSSIDQNGATVGQLSSVQITAEGFIVANYSNGSSQSLFKIPVADFANPNALTNVSGNVFSQSASSGDVSLRSAGTNGVGNIQSSALESSNVELSEELTNMIVAQRAYQANTKVITATDQLLQELNNLIR